MYRVVGISTPIQLKHEDICTERIAFHCVRLYASFMPLRRAQEALDHLVSINSCTNHSSYIRVIILLWTSAVLTQKRSSGSVRAGCTQGLEFPDSFAVEAGLSQEG